MQPKLTPATRLDDLEVRRFQEMIESPSFARLWGRVKAELERARGECERADGAVELRRAQGAVKALRTVLGLPAQVMAEMAPKKR
jgi:hypothetical protein